MIRARTLLSLVASAALGCSVLGAALAGEISTAEVPAAGYESQVIWFDHDPTRAIFLPQSELDSTTFEELHLWSATERTEMEAAIRFGQKRERGEADRECYRGAWRLVPPGKNRPSLEERLARSPLAFAGTVVATVPGWNRVRFRPVTMVYARVDEILKDVDNALRVGMVVAFDRVEGKINLFGVEACSKVPPEYESFAVGDEVLFEGSRYGRHSFFLSGALAFPIRDGQVIPQPSGLIQPMGKPHSLRKLKAAIGPGGNQ